MSSEGSISSRFSQFGLYRTIDARTEEFLKLSKKRQLRQGCVCAAISTAVTVTVVVTTLLVYEYNVINEAKRTNGQLNWLDLMNKSVNDPILQERFNKGNIKIDRTTLKLLPILLNGLSQNKYTEKTVEIATSIYPPFGIRDSTDNIYTKNIFADTRNWMKMPPSRLYTIEYKSSPMVYFKNPTRNVDYFTKIRKIRDHQRILKYVNKMIKEKKKEGLTEPMRSYTEKPLKNTTPIIKRTPQTKTKSVAISPKLSTEDKKSNCKCPHKIIDIMKKLLTSIQTLLSYLSGFNSNDTLPRLKTLIEINSMKSSTNHLESTTSQKLVENQEDFETETTNPIQYKTFLNRHKYTVDFTNSYDLRRDQTMKTMMNLIKPNYSKYNPYLVDFEPTETLNSISGYDVETQTISPSKEWSTASFPEYITHKATDMSTDTATTIADYILQGGTYDILLSPRTTSGISKLSENDFDEGDDHTETTAAMTKKINYLDSSSFETESNETQIKARSFEIEKTYNFKGAKTIQRIYTDRANGSIRKFGNLASKPKNTTKFSPMPYRFAPISGIFSKPTTIRTTLSTNNGKYLTSTSKDVTKTMLKINETRSQSNKITKNKVKRPIQDHVDENNLVDTKHILEEYRSKEASFNKMDEAIYKLNDETMIHTGHDVATISSDTEWELVESEERKTSIKSMIPQNRPTYLEMQRNDWRHDDNPDYDNDVFDK